MNSTIKRVMSKDEGGVEREREREKVEEDAEKLIEIDHKVNVLKAIENNNSETSGSASEKRIREKLG